jgi:hypothetical protein
MNRFDTKEDPRRRLLIQALAAGLLAGGWPRGQGFAATPKSVFRVTGTVTVNDQAATADTSIGPNTKLRIAKNSELIAILGELAIIVRSESEVGQLIGSGCARRVQDRNEHRNDRAARPRRQSGCRILRGSQGGTDVLLHLLRRVGDFGKRRPGYKVRSVGATPRSTGQHLRRQKSARTYRDCEIQKPHRRRVETNRRTDRPHTAVHDLRKPNVYRRVVYGESASDSRTLTLARSRFATDNAIGAHSPQKPLDHKIGDLFELRTGLYRVGDSL